MSDKTISTVTAALETDYAAFCRKKGAEASASICVEKSDGDIAIKILHGEEDAATVKAYAAKLKKRFGYVSDGEGEELAVDLVLPAARAGEFASALNNPEKAKLAKAFNTVAFTGALSVSRAEAAIVAAEAGFKVAKHMSKDVDYLVAGDKPGGKLDKAAALGVKVLTEPQWARLLKKSAPK